MATIGGILSSIILAAIGLILLASLSFAYGQDCCSGLVVQIVPSGGTPNLNGFHISINGQLMGSTNSRGSATIPLSEELTGDISIEAEKDDGSYSGSTVVTIPCFDASGRKYVRVSIEVSYQGAPPESTPEE